MSFCLIILAGGNSHRFKSNIGKPYQKIAGKSLIEINIDKARQFKQIKKIIIVYNKKDIKRVKSLKLKNVKLVKGGINRQQSTFNALKHLKSQKGISKVLIHDVARPNFSIKLLNSIMKNMKNARAVVPKINVQDAIKQIIDSSKEEYIIGKRRDNLFLTQTPQAFNFKEIYNFLSKNRIAYKIKNQSDMATKLSRLFLRKNASKKIQKKLKVLGQRILNLTFKEIHFIINKNEI